MSGPIPVKCLFCRSIYRRGLATRRPGLFFYFLFFVIVLSVPCRLSSRPLLIFLPLSCCQGLAACRPGLFRSFLHCCHVCVSLPSLLYYSRRCSVLVRLPCVIFAVSAPLGARLVLALEGLGITPIGRSTGRCAHSMRFLDTTWALLFGAWV